MGTTYLKSTLANVSKLPTWKMLNGWGRNNFGYQIMANLTTSKILLIAVVFVLMSISTYGAALVALPVWWFLIGKIK